MLKLQKDEVRCRSTIAVETMALFEAPETCFRLSHIINEMLDIPLASPKSTVTTNP